MARVVIAIELDTFNPDEAVYRVLHGVEVVQAVPVFDDAGQPKIKNGKPVTRDQVVDHRDVRDVIFAADDDRWFTGTGPERARRPDDEVAAEQLQIVADAFGEQAQTSANEAQAHAAKVRRLPGEGRVLPVRPRAPHSQAPGH